MEPYRKRQRIYSLQQSQFPTSFGNQYAYYDDDDRDELDDYDVDDEEEDYGDNEMIDDGRDPDSELEQKRAQVDLKLKLTYESIFEKYGKDFDGIGDEIDMETGEIVVDNGHLEEMLDERDVGENRQRRRRYQSTEESGELMGESGSCGDESTDGDDVDEEEDAGTDDEGSDDGMLEDDLILRGFAQATRGRRPEPGASQPHAPVRRHNKLRDYHVAPPEPVEAEMPSRSQIIAQFGPQVGPQILEVILQQNIRKEDESNIEEAWRIPDHLEQLQSRKMGNIEPAWRTPVIPSGRPVAESNIRLEDYDRSPSPERGASLWKPDGPKRKRGLLGYGKVKKPPPVRGIRASFTAEDDEILLDCVRKARESGKELDMSFFRGLGAQYPKHPALSWKHRYNLKYAYLGPEGIEESEPSDSDELLRPVLVAKSCKVRTGLEKPAGYRQPLSVNYQQPRPAAIRSSHSQLAISNHQLPSRMSGWGPRPRRRNSTDISWSQALPAIKRVDPTQYAGIANESRHDCEFSRSFFDLTSGQRHENRRVSDHIANFSQKSYREANSLQQEKPRRRYSDSAHGSGDGSYDLRISQNSGNTIRRVSSASNLCAPCPHVKCRNYPTLTYRLQRSIEEEQSQMSLHMLNVHHTTPYPCEEFDCIYKGENGYFMQVDLVEHVKSAHPQNEALQRLRGRVDASLLDKGTEWQQNQTFSRPGKDGSIAIRREGGFFPSSRAPGSVVPSSSQLLSSSSDIGRTVTPRGIVKAPMYTPMTSVSSMVANHPSAKSDMDMRDIDDRSSIPNTAPYYDSFRTSKAGSLDSSIRQRSMIEEQQLPTNNFGSPDINLPLNDIHQSFSSTASILGSDNFGSVEPVMSSSRQVNESTAAFTSRISLPRASPPSSIPDSQKSSSNRPQGLSHTGQLSPAPGNGLNASEKAPERETRPSGPQPAAENTMLPPPKAKPSFAKELFKPWSFRKSTRRSFPPGGRGINEEDELNLASDGFVLLSSRSRTSRPPADLPVRIKCEDTADARGTVSLVPASKKRKLESFQDDDEIDELMANELSFYISVLGPLARKQAKVKEEDAELVSVLPPPIPAGRKKKSHQRKRICQPRSAIAEFSSARPGPITSTTQTTFGRAGTPLLDLTPSRKSAKSRNTMQEIAESGAESSSQLKPVADGSSSPLNSLLTPVRQLRATTMKQEGPLIVMRTPGGTLRGCGDSGFACKSVFCLNPGCKTKKNAVGKQ